LRSTRAGAALAAGVVSVLGLTASAQAAPKAKAPAAASTPIVIGHRGAPAYRPEHTLASYELAIEMGADYIEPDLVPTKDHQLVARHENDITQTTDVAQRPEFAARKTTKVIDGVSHTGWFTEDFTLAELETLHAAERIPDIRPFNQVFNGLYRVPTFQQVIDLAKKAHVGIYPETKHPTYFRSIGLPLEGPLVRTLKRNKLNTATSKVFVQSFEVSNLKALDKRLKVPLVQLIDATGAPADFVATGDERTYDDLVTRKGLKEIATYADGIGPDKSRIIPVDATTKKLGTPTKLIKWAHRYGLLVHPFTFRPENNFLPADYQVGDKSSPDFNRARGDQPAELKRYFKLGVDGVFADNADTARAVRDQLFG
jgi:glycerophosphoryl diester phosphodiesterase